MKYANILVTDTFLTSLNAAIEKMENGINHLSFTLETENEAIKNACSGVIEQDRLHLAVLKDWSNRASITLDNKLKS